MLEISRLKSTISVWSIWWSSQAGCWPRVCCTPSSCAHTPHGLEELQKREKLDSRPHSEWLDTLEAFKKTMPQEVLMGAFRGRKGGWKALLEVR